MLISSNQPHVSLLSYNYSYKLEKNFSAFLLKGYSSKSFLSVETVNCTTTLMSIHDALSQVYKNFIDCDIFRSQIERLHFNISTDKRSCISVVGPRKLFTIIHSITHIAPVQRLSLDSLRTVTSWKLHYNLVITRLEY